MHATSLSLQAAIALTALFDVASADRCGMGSKLVKGNWYCQPVQRIAYKGVGGQGSYNKITHMDPNTGSCSSVPHPFSGSMSPLDEDISLHFRGPLKLKQFAVYKPTSASSPKPLKRSIHERRHAHSKFHEHAREKRETEEQAAIEKRAIGDWVTATINGKVVSWANNYDGKSNPGATPAPEWITATIDGKVVSWPNPNAAQKPTPAPAPAPQPAAAPSPAPPAAAPEPAAAAPAAAPPVSKPSPALGKPAAKSNVKLSSEAIARGDWAQVGYYNSEEKTAHGVTFLNNMGGQGSGVFDMVFGNSLSYASSDGSRGAASPEVFDGTLNSNQEISIFSETSCSQADCGYVRPGTVAYKGFSGGQKAFFMEFMMPNDGQSGFNGDLPAIWALNAQIPRTAQYGKCSCWQSGCGEFDIFETLDSGSAMAKSTLHGAVNGGSSDYFVRPVSQYMKAAVIFHDDNIVVQELPADFDINNASIAAQKIFQMCDDSKTTVVDSVFRLAHN